METVPHLFCFTRNHMLRTFLYIPVFLSLLLGSVFAVPVAVDDSYTTNEDTVFSVSATGFLNDTFPADAAGWTFINNIFPFTGANGTSSSTWSNAAGNPGGAISLTRQFNAGQLSNTRTAGFSKGFTLPTTQTVRVTFDCRVTVAGASAAATATIQSRLATTGTPRNHYVHTGNSTSAWQTVTYTSTAPLAAGAQTFQVGVILTNNNVAGATGTVVLSWCEQN